MSPTVRLGVFDTVPQNTNAALVEILKDFAHAVLAYEFAAGRFDRYIPEYRAPYDDGLARAKKSAQLFLDRFGHPRAQQKIEYIDRIRVIMAEANAHGVYFTLDSV